jgi:superfamily II DNA or RNA helicase
VTRSDTEAAIRVAEDEVAQFAAQLEAAEQRLYELRQSVTATTVPPGAGDGSAWSAERKIELFRSLFRGRDDVFAVRWESRQGRAGYSPQCANEWKPGACEKPRVRCAACPNQAFAPADDRAARDHLQGRIVMGLYPLLEDDTCHLLAIDLDGESWAADVRALRNACSEIGLAPAVERSRSGAGAHVWLFFSEPVAAADARSLGTLLLTRAMTRSPTLTMASYDRLFPSQDTLPTGGFGNLIALPLQRAARDQGNTEFLDEHLHPHPNQWAFLASIPRISRQHLHDLIADERGTDALGVIDLAREERRPWRAAQPLTDRLAVVDLPRRVRATLADRLYVERDGMPAPLLDAVRRLAAFANPEFGERQAMRLSTALTPRLITCFENLPHHIALPRGCADAMDALLADLGVTLELADERVPGAPLDASFSGTLREEQALAVGELLEHEIGVLCAPPGAGKTVMGAHMIAARGRSTLVLVHRKPLVEQWVERLREFLDLGDRDIGVIGGGRRRPTGELDVATVQSLARSEIDATLLTSYGHVVVDECHHVPAVSVERVLASCPAQFVTGLTATPYRRDGHQPIIAMQCGPVRHTIGAAAETGLALRVVRRDTPFDAAALPSDAAIQEIYSALAADDDRTELIVRDTRQLLTDGRVPLILTERREHLERLATRLRTDVPTVVTLHGDVTPRRRREALARLGELPADQPRVLVATGRFIGEGFDDPRLDTLLLTMPIAWKGTVVQYAGRLHRPHPGKRDACIYDYVDAEVPVLRRMFAKRARSYRAMSYAIDSA